MFLGKEKGGEKGEKTVAWRQILFRPDMAGRRLPDPAFWRIRHAISDQFSPNGGLWRTVDELC